MDGETASNKESPQDVQQSPTEKRTAEANASDPLIGTTLDGRFEIEEVLGLGGMSVVYKARQLNVNRYVAIKTIRLHVDTKPVYRERFQREIASLCALAHPNIVTVYDCIFNSEQQPYVVMDYLRGRSLEKLLSDGPLTVDRFARISVQICSALDHAHKKGVIHRDLKPGNIILMDDEMDFVKVVDFGLVKLREEDSRKLTQSGELWGSPPYMSPEQAAGESGDERSDIYSLGCVMYQMLTGVDPFWDAKSIYELIQRHVKTPARSMAMANQDVLVPFALEAVVLKCLEKSPLSRFQTANELEKAIVQAVSGQAAGGLILHSPVATKTRLRAIEPQSEPKVVGLTYSKQVSKWARPASGQHVVSKWARPVSGRQNVSRWAGLVSGVRTTTELSQAQAKEVEKQESVAATQFDPGRSQPPPEHVQASNEQRNQTINLYSHSFNLVLILLLLLGFGLAVYFAFDAHRGHRYRPELQPAIESTTTTTDPNDQLFFSPNQLMKTPSNEQVQGQGQAPMPTGSALKEPNHGKAPIKRHPRRAKPTNVSSTKQHPAHPASQSAKQAKDPWDLLHKMEGH